MGQRFVVSMTLLGLIFSILVSPVGSQPVQAQSPVNDRPQARDLPPNRPERGLIYDGLERATDRVCQGGFRVKNTRLCTHGPDPAPAGVNVHESTAPIESFAGTTSSLAICDGDGSSGLRTQVIYVRASDKPDRYSTYLASFRQWAAEASAIYNASAAETGGVRHIRFVHDASCNILVKNVKLSSTGDDHFGNTVNELEALGYNRTDRKYMIFVDARVLCGIGSMFVDDQPGAANWNNSGSSYSRIDEGCWQGFVAAHEHMHNMGGVQDSAPHSSPYGHCTDEYDVMCYVDGPGVTMTISCSDTAHENRFDCRHDDYFHTNPPAGSYLATHWNTANNLFLIGNPDTKITSGPPAYSTSTSASFGFSSSSPKVTFQCSLDGAIWGTCTSPKSYTGLAAGAHTFQVRARSSAGLLDQSPAVRKWTVDLAAPRITGVAPAGVATGIGRRTSVEVTFSESIKTSTLTTSTYKLVKEGSTTALSAVLRYDAVSRKATLTPSSALAASSTYVARVRGGTDGIKDLAGRPLGADKVWSFTTSASSDVTSPTVSSVSPSSGATRIAPGTNVTAVFSEAMNAASLTTSTVTLVRKGTTTPLTATVRYDATNRKVILDPDSDLRSSTAYMARIKGGAAGAKDRAGNPLTADKVWTFTTQDTILPTVTGTLPAAGATGVARATNVEVTFSEAMKATTFTGSTLTLVKQGATTPVSATVSYNATTRKATLNPGADLASNTTYVATVKGGTGGVTDLAGNALGASKAWSFTTLDTTPPKIVKVSPADNAQNVPLGTNVEVYFSEAMNAATITTKSLRLYDDNGAVIAATVTYDAAARKAVLNPSSDLKSLTYYALEVNGDLSPMKDLAGNAMQDYIYSWFQTWDSTPPSLAYAYMAEKVLTLQYDRALDTTSVPPASAFVVKVNGTSRSVAEVAVQSPDSTTGSVVLTLGSAVTYGDTVTVSYTPGTPAIQGVSGAQALGFSSRGVSNETAPGPELWEATVDGTALTLQFGESLDASSVPTTGDFVVKVNGAMRGVSAVSIPAGDTSQVLLTLASPVSQADTVTVSYTPGTYPIQSPDGRLSSRFSDYEVYNYTS